MADVDRIVTLIDMDCFYCQVEEKYDPSLKGKPIAVVQYNQWKGGGIIAVNYEARARGVTRHMRGDEAKEKCPEIQLPIVPCNRGKADISKYRQAGKEVSNVLQEFSPLLERASIDEAYLDITKLVAERVERCRSSEGLSMNSLINTHVLGYDSLERYMWDVYKKTDCEDINYDHERSLRLLVGASIVGEIRDAVYEKTGYKCSAGIAHNKIMAKLVCGMNKPNKQTVLPFHCVPLLFESLPVTKIKSLGGKFGVEVCQRLNIVHMKDLLNFTEKELQKYFEEKNGSWLYNIARGIDTDPVVPRLCPKSIGCCKKFPGVTAIVEVPTLVHWVKELGSEVEERMSADIIENNRQPTQMVVTFVKEISSGKEISCSRSFNFKKGCKMDATMFAENAFELIKKDSKPFLKHPSESDGVLMHPIKFLGLSIGKFDESSSKSKISNFFAPNANVAEKSVVNTAAVEEGSASTSEMEVDETKKQDNSDIKITKQESFFLNYFKNKETIPNQSNEVVGMEGSSLLKSSFTVLQKSQRSSDEFCDSDDSTGTIDMEINTSKQLFEPKDEPCKERPGLGEAFSKLSEKTRIPDELLPPLLKPETRHYVNCKDCKKKILSDEYSTHLDYHLALSLRLDDENSDKYNQRVPKQPTPTKTKPSKAIMKETQNNIKDFFKVPNTSDLENCEIELCVECGKYIKLVNFSEHLDYHEAKKLSIELNSNKSTSLDTSGSSSGSVKRKKSVSPKSGSKKVKRDSRTRSIDSFFK